jgi:hypothetical protein
MPDSITPESHASRTSEPGGAPAAPGRLTLIYVLGNPRSGSTIFSLVLGSHPDMFFAGELCRFPEPTWNGPRLCACRVPVPQCPFWTEVVRDFGGEPPLRAFGRGQRRYELWSSLPRAFLASVTNRASYQAQLQANARLFRVLSERTGKRVIIDSSKKASRGRMFLKGAREGIDVYFLHVVRDARAFVWSETLRPDTRLDTPPQLRHSAPVLILRWIGTNLASTLLCSGPGRRYRRIRYEDFVANPAGVLDQVGRFLQMDLSPVKEKLLANEPISGGHVIGAGRVRFEGAIALRADRSWEGHLGWGIRFLYRILAGWLAFGYGYRRGATALPGTPQPAG